MNQHISEMSTRPPLSADELDRIIRQARARRATALSHGLGTLLRAIATVGRRLVTAIEHGRRLQALASLDDHRLAAMGVTRSTITAAVFGWTSETSAAPAYDPPVATNENIEPSPEREAA